MPEILHISNTPNPAAKKFHAEVLIAGPTPLSFSSKSEASSNDVAQALFGLDGVVNVFLLDQVITVNISDSEDWETLTPEIQMLLEEHLEEWHPPTTTTNQSNEDIAFPADFFGMDLELQVEHLEKILDQKIRPALAGDGGGIQLMGIDGSIVYIYYLGACRNCPSSTTGTLNQIQQTFKMLAHPELTVELS